MRQACSSIVGSLCGAIKICEGGNRGIVVNGNVIAVSNVSSHKVCVYSLSTGALESEFGGSGRQPGQLTLPQKLCLSPLTGNLFVADFGNTRVQVDASL